MNIKNLVRRAIYASARNRTVYSKLWHPLSRAVLLANREQAWLSLELGDELQFAYDDLMSKLVVQSGPFYGMRYPSAVASGSAFCPKIIGSYELELQDVVLEAVDLQPSVVVDIGAAEGYYAIGLAMRLPLTKVMTYDTNPVARESCAAMAAINGVDDRVTVRSTCESRDLLQYRGIRAMVWCDCEGFERELFDIEVCSALSLSHVLIETHDFLRPFTTTRLQKLFGPTHVVSVLRSVPDFLRPTVFPQKLLSMYTKDIQIALMAESRPAEMHWLWCRPRPETALTPI